MSHFSQEEAADRLFTSVSNLKRIESGKQSCSDETAQAMAKLYNAPWVADRTVPIDYVPKPLAVAVLHYMNEREDVDKLLPRLRRILSDGVVDDDEAAEVAVAAKEIEEEQIANRDLRYAICG